MFSGDAVAGNVFSLDRYELARIRSDENTLQSPKGRERRWEFFLFFSRAPSQEATQLAPSLFIARECFFCFCPMWFSDDEVIGNVILTDRCELARIRSDKTSLQSPKGYVMVKGEFREVGRFAFWLEWIDRTGHVFLAILKHTHQSQCPHCSFFLTSNYLKNTYHQLL